MTRALAIFSLLCFLSPRSALAQDSDPASAPKQGEAIGLGRPSTILVLAPRSGQSARPEAQNFALGLHMAVQDLGQHLKTEVDLAAATPGDIVARCPARISSNCLSQAAQKTQSDFVITGQIEAHAQVMSVVIKVLRSDSNEIKALRDINFVPSRHDSLDMQIAGRCLGQAMIHEITHSQSDNAPSPCAGRVFATSAADRRYYEQNSLAPPAQQWMTILPDIATRQAYEKRNNVLAGSFASAGALAIVGLTSSVFLFVQSRLSQGEILDFAKKNPASLQVRNGQIWLVDSSSEAATRYRSLQARQRMEALTSMSAGLASVIAAVVAVALYDQAEIPGRYEDYSEAPTQDLTRSVSAQ